MDFILIFLAIFGFVVLFLFLAMFYRRVVNTNEVHIVQYRKKTISYGKDTENGNTYYEWPSWIPILGVTKVILPVSVFDLDLQSYEAYDQGRLPFVVDVKAFFRITDSNVAAQRVASFNELQEQLRAVVQGAVRTILASNEIEEIMQGRSKFGHEFTEEVKDQLINWGVAPVKNIELMDIRDSKDSHVIHNIMAKKKSLIEMESRQEVAKNMKTAEVAEIEAQREIDVQRQIANQTVGLKTIETERQVELAKQEKIQVIKSQEKITKDREMEVIKVQNVRSAEIDKEVFVVKASQEKEASIIKADGQLAAKERESKGIAIEGNAKADAAKAMQLAPVQAQITLAKEIGENESYQKYLITIEQIKANQIVGIEQAKALCAAQIKVIANTGDASTGLNSIGELFNSTGGTKIGAMLEGFSQTEVGEKIMSKLK